MGNPPLLIVQISKRFDGIYCDSNRESNRNKTKVMTDTKLFTSGAILEINKLFQQISYFGAKSS